MPRFREFVRLSGRERRGLIKAAVLLSIVELALTVVPLATVRRLGRIADGSRASATDRDVVARTAWAVATAAEHIPFEVGCLAEAIVGDVLLRRAGLDSTITLGVRKTPNGDLEAHGWVELDGDAVIGDRRTAAGFQRLGSLNDR